MELNDSNSSALALAPSPAPVAVVSPQFCAPHVVPLTVTKKAMSFSGGDFTVTDDASGAVVLRVRGTYLSVRSHRVLHDAAGRAILTMQRKVRIFTLHSGSIDSSRVSIYCHHFLVSNCFCGLCLHGRSEESIVLLQS